MDRKKVREKQKAVKDAMKLQKAIGQLEAESQAEADHLVDDLPFGHVMENDDDEMMEDEEDV